MDDNALDIILRLKDELSPALAQAQAAIRDASGQLAGMTDAVKSSNQAHLDFIGTLKDVGAAFGIAFTLDAAVEFLHTIIENAQQLQNLSIQTRINVEDLQVLQAATKAYGVDSDTLGRALFTLSQRIARGDDSVASAYAMMGYSLDQVRGKDAIDLFLMTERGLGTLKGAIQDAASADLYGGKLGASMVAFASGSDTAIEKARGMTQASKDSNKALAEYGDAVDRAKTSLLAIATSLAGPVAQGFNTLSDAVFDKGASKWSIFLAMLKDAAASTMPGVGQSTTNLAKLLDDLNQKTDKGTASTKAGTDANTAAKVVLDARGQAAAAMAALELNSSKPILDWQVQYLQQLEAMGDLDAKHALAIGVDAQQLAAYIAQQKAKADADRIAAEVDAEADAAAMTGYTARIKMLGDLSKASLSAYSFGAQIAALQQLDAAEQVLAVDVEFSLTTEQDRAKVRADAAKQHIDLMNQETAIQLKQSQVVSAAVLDEFNAQVKLNAEWGLNASGAIAMQKTALDTLNQAMDALHLKKVDGISQAAQEQVLIDAYTKSLYDDAVAQDALTQSVVGNTKAISDNITQKQQAAAFSLAGGSAVPSQFAGMTTAQLFSAGLVDALGRVTLSGAAAGLGTGTGGVTSATFGGTRDSGGPVMPGNAYLIGKGAQPEMFIPSSPGTMVPNGAGGTTVTVNLTMTGMIDPSTGRYLASVVSDELTKQVKQNRQLTAD